jgi:cell wall assembly regulator SMI1
VALADTLRSLKGLELTDEDGGKETLELLPPVLPAELEALERRLPAPLPAEIRDALLVTKGLANGPLETFSLLDLEGFGMEEVFPHAYSIAHDGFGNYWVIDLLPNSTSWGPIYYACHDPPVIVYQAAGVEQFLRDAIAMGQGGPRSPVDIVHEDATSRIWDANPLARPRNEVLTAGDAGLSHFAESRPDKALIADLRTAKTGDGVSWGVYGPRTNIVRWDVEPVWGILRPDKKPGLLRRLFGS